MTWETKDWIGCSALLLFSTWWFLMLGFPVSDMEQSCQLDLWCSICSNGFDIRCSLACTVYPQALEFGI